MYKGRFVIKRDNSQVNFDATRIKNAIFFATQAAGEKNNLSATFLTEQVVEKLNKKYDADTQTTPKVEEIQDIVETVLLAHNHVDVARAFIKYRARHEDARNVKKKELLEKIGRHEATIINEKGIKEPFDMEKILAVLDFYCCDLPKIDVKKLILEAVSNLYDGISISELESALINAARSKIEVDQQYSLLSARLLLKSLYKKVLNLSITKSQSKFKRAYRANFVSYIEKGVSDGLLDKRMLEFDLANLQESLLPSRDDLFHFRGIKTVYDRYLLRTEKGKMFELPQYFWMRVAMGISLAEDKANRNEWAVKFYHLISEMLYLPSTPTLFNAGTVHPQLSSCFLNSVDDSLDDIFKSFSDNAKLSKYAGGIGTDWTNVRSLGASIKGTNGVSQGVIPFLKIFNDVALAVNQGGKRKGAMCAYLEIWHSDVFEFIEAKKNTGDERRRLHDCHTAVWVPDLFMKRVEEKGEWTLFSPSDVPDLHDLYGKAFEERYLEYEKKNLSLIRKVSAESLWRKLLTILYETGHPWITFKDPCNIRNPQSHVGVVHNSNLCTEITLNNSSDETAVCNLGSLNLSKFVNMGAVDYKMLKSTVTLAMRMLDNVIDVNYYPTKEAKNANDRHRPVGLGMMGYQDMLYKLNYPFCSSKHIEFADELMEKISYYAISASSDLSMTRGSYQTYQGSMWERGIFPLDTIEKLSKERGQRIEVDLDYKEDWQSLKDKVKRQGMRNSNCMAIAPTATISNIAGVYPCVEPVFRNIYVKENTDGTFIVINQFLVNDLAELGLWNDQMLNKIKFYNGSVQEIAEVPPAIKERYRETFEIDSKWIIAAGAKRGKWIDQSQSLNIFLANVTGKVLSDTYFNAWRSGLKTTYYLRSLAKSQVSKANTDMAGVNKNQANEGDNVISSDNKIKSTDKAKIEKVGNAHLCSIDDSDCEACE